MIEPVDEDEREQLLRELLIERFGRPPSREGPSKVIAARRRVLVGIEKQEEAEA